MSAGTLTRVHWDALVSLHRQGRFSELIDAAEALTPHAQQGGALAALLGGAYLAEQRFEDAQRSFSRAIALLPDRPDLYNNLGVALYRGRRHHEAIDALERALALNADYLSAHQNLGLVYSALDLHELAIAAFTSVLRIDPTNSVARAKRLYRMAHLCDWSGIEAELEALPALGVVGAALSPFVLLALEDAPERHRIRAERYVQNAAPAAKLAPLASPKARPAQLRIGYFSGDFHEHATMHLIAKLLETHDRERFQIYAYSYGHEPADEMRARAIAAVDVFRDVSNMTDQQAAECARADGLDIAVDLKGHTSYARYQVLERRPAPVQISYLGYPGTIGADYIDYIVADSVVIPPGLRRHYSERVIFLPDTYQVNDNTRAIDAGGIQRADEQLPAGAFVFCCFNNAFKIGAAEFDIWMRLLRQVEHGVLWLLGSNPRMVENLRREAAARGIDPHRLVFAQRVPPARHLARHQFADLFVDTFNYTAHTTAADALWTGLPVVTKAGEGFAARVAASLLTAIKLPELITTNVRDYEALCVELATNPSLLTEVREKLRANRLSTPLFDTERFCRRLEAGYDAAFDRYLTGALSADIYVKG